MCCDDLHAAFPGAPKDCFDQKLTAEEKGKKFKIEAAKGSAEAFCRAKIDGCIVKGSEKERCDYLFLRCKTGDLWFVELKGKDVKKGFDQLLATITMVKPLLKFSKEKVSAFIVSSRVPNGADVQNMKATFRKNHGHRLEVKNGEWVERLP